MNTNSIRTIAICCCLGLAGCAAESLQGHAARQASVKHGWVSGFYSAETPRAALPACLAQLPPDQLESRHFVKIDYRHVRKMLIEVAELPPTPDPQSVRIGDHVELIQQDCAAGQLSHITKFLQ